MTRLKNVTCQLLIDEVYCQSGQSHWQRGGNWVSFWPGIFIRNGHVAPLKIHVASLKVCAASLKVHVASLKVCVVSLKVSVALLKVSVASLNVWRV